MSFPSPQLSEVLDSWKNTSIHCSLQGQGQSDDQNASCPAAASQESCDAWLHGQRAPQKVMEAAWENEATAWREEQSVPLSGAPHSTAVEGGSNWFQTLSRGRALYLAASQGSQFGIRVGYGRGWRRIQPERASAPLLGGERHRRESRTAPSPTPVSQAAADPVSHCRKSSLPRSCLGRGAEKKLRAASQRLVCSAVVQQQLDSALRNSSCFTAPFRSTLQGPAFLG